MGGVETPGPYPSFLATEALATSAKSEISFLRKKSENQLSVIKICYFRRMDATVSQLARVGIRSVTTANASFWAMWRRSPPCGSKLKPKRRCSGLDGHGIRAVR